MISLRKQIQDSENAEGRARALAKAFLGLIAEVPKAALPANAGLAAQARESLEKAGEPLKGEPRVPEIDNAGAVAVQQVDEICNSNKVAIEERDAALKEVVETVAWAIGSFKSHGERHKTSLTKLADGFDTLSRVEDVNELRRRLREDVATLREDVYKRQITDIGPDYCVRQTVSEKRSATHGRPASAPAQDLFRAKRIRVSILL